MFLSTLYIAIDPPIVYLRNPYVSTLVKPYNLLSLVLCRKYSYNSYTEVTVKATTNTTEQNHCSYIAM